MITIISQLMSSPEMLSVNDILGGLDEKHFLTEQRLNRLLG